MNTRICSMSLIWALLSPLTVMVLEHRPIVAEEKPLEVRIYSSLLAGANDKEAQDFSQPMVDLIARRLNYPVRLDVAKGQSAPELFRFGKEINEGKCHLGVVSGLECGWLWQKFPRLQPMALASPAADIRVYRCQFMVRVESDAENFSHLKGTKLATYRGEGSNERIYLQRLLKEYHTSREDHFELREYPTVSRAISAVDTGDADCVLVNKLQYARFFDLHPGCRLKHLEQSAPFPRAVFLGRKVLVDGLQSDRRDLWVDIQRELTRIHATAEGEQCAEFWRMERFDLPDQQFDREVQEVVKVYPISLLPDAGAPLR